MSKTISGTLCGALLLLLLLLAVQSGSAAPYPDFVGYVNDYAHLLSAPQATALNQDLRDFDNRTTIEVAVVTVDSIGSESPGDYAVNLGNYWGVGKRDTDNGIVFLVAMESHDIWIEAGPGLSGQISDRQVQQVVDNVVIPQFRADRPDLGVINGVHSIIGHFEGSTIPDTTAPVSSSPRNLGMAQNPSSLLIGAAVVILAIVFILFALFPRIFQNMPHYENKDDEEAETVSDHDRATSVDHEGFGSSGSDDFGGGDMGGGSSGGGKW